LGSSKRKEDERTEGKRGFGVVVYAKLNGRKKK